MSDIIGARIVGVYASEDGMGVAISWTEDAGYFGEISIIQSPGGKPRIDTEHTGKDFAKRVLSALIDKATEEDK